MAMNFMGQRLVTDLEQLPNFCTHVDHQASVNKQNMAQQVCPVIDVGTHSISKPCVMTGTDVGNSNLDRAINGIFSEGFDEDTFLGIHMDSMDIDEWLTFLDSLENSLQNMTQEMSLTNDVRRSNNSETCDTTKTDNGNSNIFQVCATHMSPDEYFKTPKTYECSFCPRISYNKTAYMRHYIRHAKIKLRCFYCQYKARTSDQLQRHCNYNHGCSRRPTDFSAL